MPPDPTIIASLLKVNGLTPASPREQVYALLAKAGYTQEEITQITANLASLPALSSAPATPPLQPPTIAAPVTPVSPPTAGVPTARGPVPPPAIQKGKSSSLFVTLGILIIILLVVGDGGYAFYTLNKSNSLPSLLSLLHGIPAFPSGLSPNAPVPTTPVAETSSPTTSTTPPSLATIPPTTTAPSTNPLLIPGIYDLSPHGTPTMQVPVGWTVSGPGSSDQSLPYAFATFLGPGGDGAIDFQISPKTDTLSSEASVQEHFSYDASSDPTTLNQGAVTVDGVTGYMLEAEITTTVNGAATLRHIRIYDFVASSKDYSINVSSSEQNWNTLEPAIDAAMATAQIN